MLRHSMDFRNDFAKRVLLRAGMLQVKRSRKQIRIPIGTVEAFFVLSDDHDICTFSVKRSNEVSSQIFKMRGTMLEDTIVATVVSECTTEIKVVYIYLEDCPLTVDTISKGHNSIVIYALDCSVSNHVYYKGKPFFFDKRFLLTTDDTR